MHKKRKYLPILVSSSLLIWPIQATYADDDDEYESYEDYDEGYEEEEDGEWYGTEEKRQTMIEETWYAWSRASSAILANETLPVTKQQEVKLQLPNKTAIWIDVLPYQGQLLVPLKSVAQYLGADVYVYKNSRAMEVVDEDVHLIFKEGSLAVYENMAKTPMPTATLNVNGKVYVPISVIGGALGWDVSWTDETVQMQKRGSINGKR
ncbi:copper amine oxidase N-terminal domain-containing protein [Bacillus sp. REN10]|uniref:copper amine oxidase N-terminal domain-containing protein n=1 Tax=Bacillus sp. REN10 TaxID=2782541 RepID=UPI00193C3642|nr:copper amine oxidase N-terminal domain-containing protein [Bacillus sp. REN10]